ncbi:Flp family type IVb pilin [Rhabdothermincola sp.]|jgi:Flp pilus assembly pilin Flp|uniref:Flp family type IVb pilin n=1 Tax=Rhabdothermincola sp. TaxID=2820405 RepID=UPI002FE36F92
MGYVDRGRDGLAGDRMRGDEGANLVEYLLLVSLICVICLVAVSAFRKEVDKKFVYSASEISVAGR